MTATACVPAADEPPAQDHDVAGRVHGLWDGADGVVLRLHASGADVLRTVSTNGAFRFDAALAAGSAYAVTVARSPAQHDCVIEHGGTGAVADASAPSVSVACKGPDLAIALSGAWGWSFDPTQEVQTFAGPLGARDVALTVTGTAAMQARIAGATVALGEPTAPIDLPLGTRAVPVSVQASGGLSKTYELVFERAASLVAQVAYGKASNTDTLDQFGFAVSLSGDTLAVGAPAEASNARGVNGNQANNSAGFAGAVYVFVRNATTGTWSQQAYLKASNTEAGDQFGISVSLSGNTLAVGASSEDSGTASNQNNNAVQDSGAAYVFVRNGTTWSQQAYLKASSTRAFAHFGTAVALSGDTVAVGAPGENISDGLTGTVYVFQRSGTRWAQQASIQASNADPDDGFGQSLALSGDTLAVGAPGEDSAATGVDGDQNDNSVLDSGAAYVFVRNGTTWSQQAYLKASNTMSNPGAGAAFGSSISLSSETLAVGSKFEWGGAVQSGAVYVFVRSAAQWTQQAYLKASNFNAGDHFGDEVVISGDQLVVGATQEASIATGINGNQSDNSAPAAGAAYLFTRSAGVWTQQSYIKASNTGPSIIDRTGDRAPINDRFGEGLALSGTTLVVGASWESGGSTGFNGNQADDSKRRAGAIYIFQQ